ncbi:sigma factor-like helix-turn-helix DNA-binding protein [Sphingomonas sp. ERG5]|uniref:sigma factor-like helix-turn-helix DNA-binding protein n=1 Tax=Sphingomonas sp. ERG5 TaxID=1381597 RepID=UPI0009DEAACE|nr:sigma factor-like helix-turn-helix DNA-binding protein [Sphingomonas sp. ERG5]
MREELSDAETIARLERALRRMPKLQREIFLAIRFDNLAYPEIAERTGLSVRQVERHFAKSLRHIVDARGGRARGAIWRRLFRWIKERRHC